jgi:hypothetical protein
MLGYLLLTSCVMYISPWCPSLANHAVTCRCTRLVDMAATVSFKFIDTSLKQNFAMDGRFSGMAEHIIDDNHEGNSDADVVIRMSW